MVLTLYSVSCYYCTVLYLQVFSGPPSLDVALQFTFLFFINDALCELGGATKHTIMKTILRRAAVAFAAVLIGCTAMAQSLDFKKEFSTDIDDMLLYSIQPEFTKDGKARLVVFDNEGDGYMYDSETGRETYEKRVTKINLLNEDLEIEKTLTSGPLFEVFTSATVISAVKTLKIDYVRTSAGLENDFYHHMSFEVDGNFYTYDELINTFVESKIKPILEGYTTSYYTEENGWYQTTYNGYKVFYNNYETSSDFDWEKQYPRYGFLYKAYNDIEWINFYYTGDDTEEVERYNSRIESILHTDEIYYIDFESGFTEKYTTITQNLFNDDDKYEYILPELALFTETRYDEYSNRTITEEEYRCIGYKIVSEDGTVIHKMTINETKEENIDCWGYLLKFGEKFYFVIEKEESEESEGKTEYTDTTYFYEIKKNGSSSSIEKVREIRGSMNIRPTVADRNEEITITVNDDNNVARELIVTSVNGQLIERRAIPAGENTIKVNAAMMRSGMYNFTLQKKGEIVDNGKVIVK